MEAAANCTPGFMKNSFQFWVQRDEETLLRFKNQELFWLNSWWGHWMWSRRFSVPSFSRHPRVHTARRPKYGVNVWWILDPACYISWLATALMDPLPIMHKAAGVQRAFRDEEENQLMSGVLLSPSWLLKGVANLPGRWMHELIWTDCL